MKILVCDIFFNDKKNIVTCQSAFGKYNIVWDGEVPLMSQEYDIEIEIPNTLIWREDIVCARENYFSMITTDGITKIIGKLESLDDDGYGVIRVGDDIIAFVAEGTPFKIHNMISIKALSLLAFSVNY